MPRCSVTTSWWPCRCGSSTSTCVGWQRKTWSSWSSGGARWRTAVTLPAAASSASHRKRSLNDKKQTCNKKWTNWLVKTPACDWSWMRFVPGTRPCSASPGLSPAGLPVRWPPPASSLLSSLPITAPAPLRFRHPRSADWQRLPSSFWSNPALNLDWPAGRRSTHTERKLSGQTEGRVEALICVSTTGCIYFFTSLSFTHSQNTHTYKTHLYCLCTVL